MGRRRREADGSGGPRHHRQARLAEERAVVVERHNRKYRRALKQGKIKAKDGFSVADNGADEKQTPRTLEMNRPPQELDVLQVRGKQEHDASAYQPIYSFFAGPTVKDPKVLITTAKHPSRQTAAFAAEYLADLFPCSEYHAREGFSVKAIAAEARPLGFTHILVVGQEARRKQPDALVIVLLGADDAASMTSYFRLTSIRCTHKEIQNKGRSTPHFPELILNHFTTGLGKAVGHLFISLFPAKPEFTGRQVVTLHNQRDFIFVRRHRYVFDDLPQGVRDRYGDQDGLGKHARLQEIGPSFTMKLEAVQRGTFEPHHAIMTSQSASLSRPSTDACPAAIRKAETVQAARFKKFLL